MQAAIKRKVERQRRRTNELGEGAGDIQVATPQPHCRQRPAQAPQQATLSAAEDRRLVEETLEEMMQRPQRRERESEEAEPVDLLPIVDSVFGQVGVFMSICVSVCVCVLRVIECLTGSLIETLSLQFKFKALLRSTWFW